MRQSESLLPMAATAVTGFVLVAGIFLSPTLAEAAEAKAKPQASQQQQTRQQPQAQPQAQAPKLQPLPKAEQKSGGAACTCPEQNRTSPWVRPKYAGLGTLDDNDHIAALESVQFALNEVGDGGTYTWELTNGRISGAVKPTSSFRDGSGKVCRHLVVLLSAGERNAKTEGVACRMPDGRWQLEG